MSIRLHVSSRSAHSGFLNALKRILRAVVALSGVRTRCSSDAPDDTSRSTPSIVKLRRSARYRRLGSAAGGGIGGQFDTRARTVIRNKLQPCDAERHNAPAIRRDGRARRRYLAPVNAAAPPS